MLVPALAGFSLLLLMGASGKKKKQSAVEVEEAAEELADPETDAFTELAKQQGAQVLPPSVVVGAKPAPVQEVLPVDDDEPDEPDEPDDDEPDELVEAVEVDDDDESTNPKGPFELPPEVAKETELVGVPIAPPAPPAPPAQPAPPAPPAQEVAKETAPVQEIPVPPPKPQASAPSVVPEDTAALVSVMLQEEASPGWKRASGELRHWQAARGLKADGLLGPKTALAIASEVGTVPIVRYWPRGTYREGSWLKDYRQALRVLSLKAKEPRKSQLEAAADREQGQGWGSASGPIKNTIQLSKVS